VRAHSELENMAQEGTVVYRGHYPAICQKVQMYNGAISSGVCVLYKTQIVETITQVYAFDA
jgi:hypothetical protein